MSSTDFELHLTTQTTIVSNADAVSNDLDGEVIILNMKTGQYFGLDEIGKEIWNLVQSPRKPDEIIEHILETYDVDPDRCENDILRLLQAMANEGLIETKYEAVA